MVVVIKSENDVKRVKEVLSNRNVKKFDAHKFCGVLKIEEDALKIQKRWRNEWE